MTDLSSKHQEFADYYLVSGNATKAYKLAYGQESDRTAESNGSRLLQDERIQAYINERRQVLRQATDDVLKKTVERLESISAANLADFMTWENDQVTIVESAKLTREQTYAIKRLKARKRPIMGSDGDIVSEALEIDIELHNKEAALKLLSSYYGIDSDFNNAILTLHRYGLYLRRDTDQPSGWRVDKEG